MTPAVQTAVDAIKNQFGDEKELVAADRDGGPI